MKVSWLRLIALVVLVLAATLGVAACGGDDDEAASTDGGNGGGDDLSAVIEELGGAADFGEAQKGGTFRMQLSDFGFTAGFDPSAEYLGSGWNTLTTMVRPLLGYRFTAGVAGNELVPDGAAELPEVSEDGLTYTFTIKDGLKFGPPVNREITSKDYLYAFERLGTPSVGAGYANYYQPIMGFTEFSTGKAKTISGIKTPDDKTIVFTLSKPQADITYALAMPASGPIPPEVGKCHQANTEYGRYVIASGPYMLEGSDRLNISNCGAQKPISGFNPTRKMTLVRNPSYDPATDSPENREANPDRIEITINTNLDDIFQRIANGEADASYDSPPTNVIRDFVQDPEKRQQLRVNGGDRTWYLTMNLTQPPFDDIHVRKAMNYAMNLQGMQRAWGGPVAGDVATNIIPDDLLDGQLPSTEYQPYQKPPFDGDVEAAKAEMMQSKYDTDQDGMCDAPACKGIVMINRNYGPWAAFTPLVREGAASIGIDLNVRELPTSAAYTTTQTPSRKIAIAGNHGWGKDYGDPASFAVLFYGPNIIPSNNSNTALIGITPAQAQQFDITLPEGGVPSVDADVDACSAVRDDTRLDCYAALDKKLMEEIVPFVPYLDSTNTELISPAVTKYDYDQFSSEISLNHVAVNPELQK